ncbi:hypothetical protein [Actinoplanes sp. NPDC049265]|uniref:hypothetical protein n=1 Tax=Actinoplanes sp. NPDC049265 TaxID=3363902 RepID=UPI00371C4661
MANAAEQQEERLRERRERERAEQRREQKLEELREKALEEERERVKEEQRRVDALEEARAEAAGERRRADRHANTVARIRAQRRAERDSRERNAARRAGRLESTRRAAAIAARAMRAALLSATERAEEERERRRREESAAERREVRDQTARDERREQLRDEQRGSARQEERREQARERRRAEARGEERREQAQGEVRERRRAEARGEERRERVQDEARERRRDEAREEERREQARGERRDTAREQRRQSARAGSGSAPTRLRVHGPLLLDEADQPVRLRAVHVPGFDHAVPGPDGDYAPAVPEPDLDLLVRWGVTAVSVPIALDHVVAAAPVPDPDLRLPAGAAPIPAESDPADDGAAYLDALDATVRAAQDRGLYTIVQLATVRSGGDGQPLSFADFRRLWRVVGRRWSDSPTVLFDLLRNPVAVVLEQPGPARPDVAARQLHTFLLAMLGELRAEHPAAIAIAGFLTGTAGSRPLSYTDGRPAPGVITGFRPGARPEIPPELTTLARRVPVAVLGWAAGNEFPNDAVGRRLASSGLHWVAEGWPAAGTLTPGRAPVATEAGRAVRTALAQSDVPVATGTGRDGPVRPALPAVAGGGGGVGPINRLLAQLLLGQVPPLPANIAPGPPGSAERVYLPGAVTLEGRLRPLSVADRERRITDLRTPVLADWQRAQGDGSLAMLGRVRAAERTARAAGPRVPADLTGAVPRFFRQDLDLAASSGAALGQALLTGAITVADAARGARTSSQAIVGLRKVQDIILRLRVARAAATATGASPELVLALYRTEGALALPPSAVSIDAGVPSGTTDAVTSLRPTPDISNLVWLAAAAPLAARTDAFVMALATNSYLLQVAGLDILAGDTPGGVAYRDFSYRTWKAAGVDDLGAALARGLVLRDAVTLRRFTPPPPAVAAVAAPVKDPERFLVTVLGDGVQLLRTFTGTEWLFGPGPLPAGAPAVLDLPFAYLRYNIGTDQVRLLLASALIAAGGTSGNRWRALRTRIAATPGLRTQLNNLATAAGPVRTAAEKATAATAVWTPLRPWCLTPGNLDLLLAFVYEATGAEWSSGWQRPRANVARFRLLHHYYGLVVNP